MSTINVYSRFGGKDGVIEQLYISGFKRLINELEAVPITTDVVGDIFQLARAYRVFALTHPTYYGVMFRTSIPTFVPTEEAGALAVQALRPLATRVTEGLRSGVFQGPPGSTPTTIASWLWASCHGMLNLEHLGVASRLVSWREVYVLGLQNALDGLCAGAPVDEHSQT